MSLDILDIERRILRACKTIRALPDPERKFMNIANCWPLTLKEAEEAYGYNDVIMPRFRPTPQDVSDCLVALAWARGISRRAFKLVWWRSFGLSHRQIGLRLGRSDETIRRWYKDAILGLWYEANNVPKSLHLRTQPYSYPPPIRAMTYATSRSSPENETAGVKAEIAGGAAQGERG